MVRSHWDPIWDRINFLNSPLHTSISLVLIPMVKITLASIDYTPRIASVLGPRLNRRPYTHNYQQTVWLHIELEM